MSKIKNYTPLGTVPYKNRIPNSFSYTEMMEALFPFKEKSVYKRYRRKSMAIDIKKNPKRTPGTGNWKKKPIRGLYALRNKVHRDTIVEYFTKHPEFGSTEWFDSDEEIASRQRSKGLRRAAHKCEVWKCPDCEKVWQSTAESMCYTHEVLAPSNWKNIPLNKNKCPRCKGKGDSRENE